MKVIEKDYLIKKKRKQIIINEKNIMKKLDHPFIISLKFAFEMAHHAIFVL
jgi:serine/threonine protein kinase